MTKNSYLLFGFACGRLEAPQFVEPIFFYNEKLWVQSVSKDSDIIQYFVEYDEDIEILEPSSIEKRQVGQDRLFAVCDIGDRIVCGDRAYVSKYLSQNFKNYLDKPYFLNDASRFANKTLSDLYFVKTDYDLIQAAALAGSLRRFCEREIIHSKNSKSNQSIYITDNSTEEVNEIIKIFSSSDGSTIFRRWLDFAEKDSPRLARHSEWKNIDNNYRAIFSKKTKNIDKYTFIFFKLSKNYVDSIASNNDHKTNTPEFASVKSFYLKHRVINSFRHFDLNISISDGRSPIASSIQKNSGDILKKMINYVQRRITSSIEEKKISAVELSMSVYFINLVIKFTINKIDEK